MTYASVAASAEPVNETDQEFRAIYLKALDDAIPNNMGQLMIRGHSLSCTVRRTAPLLDCFFFGHVFSTFGFAIIARSRLPILPALCVDSILDQNSAEPQQRRAKQAAR